MATEEQKNNQQTLNDLLNDYKSGQIEAAEYTALMTSRTADLSDALRQTVKLKKTSSELDKQLLGSVKRISDLARTLESPYTKISDVQKDIIKSQKEQVKLDNTLFVLKNKLGTIIDKKGISQLKKAEDYIALQDKVLANEEDFEQTRAKASAQEKKYADILVTNERALQAEIKKRGDLYESVNRKEFDANKKLLEEKKKAEKDAINEASQLRQNQFSASESLQSATKEVTKLKESGLGPNDIEFKEAEEARLRAQQNYDLSKEATLNKELQIKGITRDITSFAEESFTSKEKELLTSFEIEKNLKKEKKDTDEIIKSNKNINSTLIDQVTQKGVALDRSIDDLATQEKGLSTDAKVYAQGVATSEINKANTEYLGTQEEYLKDIEKRQASYNLTLGFAEGLLKKLGANNAAIALGLEEGKKAAAEMAKAIEDGKESSGIFGGQLKVLGAGIKGTFKSMAEGLKPLALFVAGFTLLGKTLGGAIKKLVVDPLKGAFNALLAPAKTLVSDITGLFTSAFDYIKTNFFSIKGLMETQISGEGLLKEVSQAVEDIATGLGISTKEAESLKAQVAGIANEMGAVPEKLAQNMAELNKAFGTTQRFSDETARSFNRMVERLGFSTEEASQLVKISQLEGQTTNDTLKTIEDQTLALKNQYGVAISSKSIYQEIAKASAATRLTLGNNAEELAKGAFQAKRLGLEMDQVASIGDNLLQFESSIASEMEAELLLGRDLNLDRARQLALQGDIAGVAKEIAGQIGSAAEFAEMNVIQQEALAKSVGVNRNELAKMLETQEMLANTGFDDMNQAQQEFNKLVESSGSIEKAQAKFRQQYGNEALASQAAQVSFAKQRELQERTILETQAKMAQVMLPVANAMLRLQESFQTIREIIVKQMRPFFKSLGGFIGGAGKDMKKGLVTYAEQLGKRLNDIGLTLVKFSRKNGPEIKKTFMSILDVFGSIYGLVGDIIKELFNIKGTSNVADPLKRGLDIIKGTAESVSNYIKGIDAASIASDIKSAVSGIVGFYEKLRDTVNYIKENPWKILGGGAGVIFGPKLIRGIANLFLGRGSRSNPMFTKNVDGPGGGMFKKLIDGLKGKTYKGGQFMPGGGRAPAGGAVAGRNLMGLQFGSALGGSAGSTATALGGTALGTVGAVAGGAMGIAAIGKGIYDVSQLNNFSTEGEKAKAKGGLGGAVGGAAIGAAIGSVVPVVGTLLGAGIGAVVGYASGRMIGGLDKFKDKLDKARKKLIKSEEFNSRSQSQLQAANNLALTNTLDNLKVKFENISSLDEDGNLQTPREELIKFAKDAFSAGKLSKKEFQDVLEGKLTGVDVLNVAAQNAQIQAERIKEAQETQVETAGQRAQRLAEEKTREGGKNIIRLGQAEAGAEQVKGLLDESGNLQDVEKRGKNLLNFIESEQYNFLKGFSPDVILSAYETGFESYTYTNTDGQRFSKKFTEDQSKAFKTYFDAVYSDLDQAIQVNVGPERLEEYTKRSISKLGNVYNLFDRDFFGAEIGTNLEQLSTGLGAGLSSSVAELETIANNVKAAKDEAEGTANVNQTNLVDFQKALDENFHYLNVMSENALSGGVEDVEKEGNVVKFYTDEITDFFHEQSKAIPNEADKRKFVTELDGLITSFKEDAKITSEEQTKLQEFIISFANILPKDIATSFTESEFYKENLIEDGIIPSRSIQKVADAANISNNGPFTIQDSRGNLAVTHPNDKLVVSPNVSYVADGMSGKGGPVFPVSEKFGALDVKVGKEGVLVQKINDGITGNPAHNTLQLPHDDHSKSMLHVGGGVSNKIKEGYRKPELGLHGEYNLGKNLSLTGGLHKGRDHGHTHLGGEVGLKFNINDGILNHINTAQYAITNPVTGEVKSIIIPELQNLELDLNTLNAAIGLLQELLLKGNIPSYEGTQAQALFVDYKDGTKDLVYNMERKSINIARSIVNTIERMGAAEYLVEIGKQAGEVTETILQSSSPSGSYQNIQYQISKAQTVQDGSSISHNGPFTIQDSKGNLAITHPKDKLVVSPNVSYIADGATGKGGPVFPVSEKFGALDVKVGKEGVLVQKINDGITSSLTNETTINHINTSQQVMDGFTGLTELRQAEKEGLPVEYQPGVNVVGAKGPFTSRDTIEPLQIGSRIIKGLGALAKIYKLSSEQKEERSNLQQEWNENYRIAYNLSKKGLDSQFAVEGVSPYYRTVTKFERLVNSINKTEKEAISKHVPIFFHDMMAKEEGRAAHDTNDYGTAIQLGFTEGQGGAIKYDPQGRPSNVSMILNTYVEPSKLYKNYTPPVPEAEVTESIVPKRITSEATERVTVRGTEGNTFVTYENGKVVESSTIQQIQDGFTEEELETRRKRFAEAGKTNVSYKEVRGTTSATRIASPDVISQLGVSGVTSENYKNLFTSTAGDDRNSSMYVILGDISKAQSLSPFQPSGKSPATDSFTVNYKDGKTDQILNSGELSFPQDDYISNISSISASGNGLLALYRAIERGGTSKADKYTIGFKQNRESSVSQFNTDQINDLAGTFNAIRNVLLYETVYDDPNALPNRKTMAHFIPKDFIDQTGAENVIKNYLNATYSNYVPPSIAKGAVEANENIYPFLGLEPYDFSFLPEILDNITPFTFSSLNNYNDPAVESKYAAEKVAPKAIREAFEPQYKERVFKFLRTQFDNDNTLLNFEALYDPKFGSQAKYDNFFKKRKYKPGSKPPASLTKKSGEYAEGSIERLPQEVKDGITNSSEINPISLVAEYGKEAFDTITNFVSDPYNHLSKILEKSAEKSIEKILKVFTNPTIKKSAFNLAKNTSKTVKLPYISPVIDALIGAEQGVTALNKYKENPDSPPISKLYQELGTIGYQTLGGIGGSFLGGSVLTPIMGPIGTVIGGLAGQFLGGYLGEFIANKFGAESFGEGLVNTFTSIPQQVEDAGASADRGPFHITDRFGATAVTAKGDGVVVSPNISYVQDGVTNAEPIAPMVATSSQQHTTVIEQDNSELKKELEGMKQLMSQLIKEIPEIANRPITIELDGNKVGEGLGRIGYRG